MNHGFNKATKHESKLRMALFGPAGSGKTYSALNIGKHLGEKIAVIDTERGSSSKYADLFEFDVCELENFSPQNYVNTIKMAGQAGYDLLVIDSLTHAWSGKGGALEMKDNASKRNSGNSFAAWRDVTPAHNALDDAILDAPCHVIVTMRSKTEYVIEQNSQGKSVPKKVGLAPVQKDGLEYEFDIVGEMNQENDLIVTKTRCAALTNEVFSKPGEDLAKVIADWVTGAPMPERPKQQATPPQQPKPNTGSGNGNGNGTGKAKLSDAQLQRIGILCDQKLAPGAAIHKGISHIIGREISSRKDLTPAEATKVIEHLSKMPDYSAEEAK